MLVCLNRCTTPWLLSGLVGVAFCWLLSCVFILFLRALQLELQKQKTMPGKLCGQFLFTRYLQPLLSFVWFQTVPLLIMCSLCFCIFHFKSNWDGHWNHNICHNSRCCGKLDLLIIDYITGHTLLILTFNSRFFFHKFI